ncbi:MAG: DNA polymerase IV [Candidatus Aenigmarchaeota archaeon]|nr:DNA polymerase IV [Candidatus Aenigmarchaeota archaeon]
MHIDMDAFYAAVEERDSPELKGRPVVVGASPKGGKGRGVVSTANYLARKYGIHSGMPISIAYRKCPSAVFLPVNMRKYHAVSQEIMGIVRKHGEKFEQVSVDEAFLELHKSYDEAAEIAKKVKEEIKERERLTCSIGIGPNKLVAKIASDYRKPDGLTVVKPEDVLSFLSPLNVRKIPGIGPKTEAALKARGIETVRQLRATPLFALKEWFGDKFGGYFHEMARGIDESPLEEEREAKSAGAEHTFDEDTNDRTKIYGVLAQMARAVVKPLKNQKFKTIAIKIRYENFETHTAQRTLKHYSGSYEESLEVAKKLLEPFLQKNRKIRLIGLSVRKFG